MPTVLVLTAPEAAVAGYSSSAASPRSDDVGRWIRQHLRGAFHQLDLELHGRLTDREHHVGMVIEPNSCPRLLRAACRHPMLTDGHLR